MKQRAALLQGVDGFVPRTFVLQSSSKRCSVAVAWCDDDVVRHLPIATLLTGPGKGSRRLYGDTQEFPPCIPRRKEKKKLTDNTSLASQSPACPRAAASWSSANDSE